MSAELRADGTVEVRVEDHHRRRERTGGGHIEDGVQHVGAAEAGDRDIRCAAVAALVTTHIPRGVRRADLHDVDVNRRREQWQVVKNGG